jgi:hypothetical protein
MNKDAIIDYWIQTSDRDYHTVKSLFESGDYHWASCLGEITKSGICSRNRYESAPHS